MPQYRFVTFINTFSLIKFQCLFLLVFVCHLQLVAQSTGSIKGVPPIVHFNHSNYNGDSQFWAACQDNNGLMYFGNNDGILIFDGEHWQKVFLPNNSSVRSLLCAGNGKVYAGGFNDFGSVEPDGMGGFKFESMIHLLRLEDRNFENIWQIHELNGTIVFRSFNALITIHQQKAGIIKATSTFTHSEIHGDLLYLLDAKGLLSLNISDLLLKPMLMRASFGNEDFLTLLSTKTKNSYFLLTKQGGVYLWNQNSGQIKLQQRIIPLKSNNLITSAIQMNNGEIYTGTLSSKMWKWEIIDNEWVMAGTFPDLQDNTVLNLFESREGNIWVLLNNGLDCFDRLSPMTTLFKNASIFDVLNDNGKLYLATNQGVFVSAGTDNNFSTPEFIKIQGLEGQAWSLQKVFDKVVCSHDRGLFVIDNDKSTPIAGVTGVWKLYPTGSDANSQLVCTYNGLYHLTYSPLNGFTIKNKLEGFTESSRDILATDQPGFFWICHGYKGVFKIKINADFTNVISIEHFTDKNGLPSAYNINVHQWLNQTVFTSNSGLFEFNHQSNAFEPHKQLNTILGTEKNIRKMVQKNQNTWVVIDDEVAYFNSNNPTVIKDPFLALKGTLNRGMECIVPINDSNVLIGTTSGLFAYGLQKDNTKIQPMVNFAAVTYNYRSKLQTLPVLASKTNIEIPFNTYDIKFLFAVPLFRDKKNVQYSYLLEGSGNTWSEWQREPYKSFTHLKSGTYTLRVKARSLSGEIANECTYRFEVLPVWYRTKPAIALWLMLFVLSNWYIFRWIKKTIAHEKEKTRQEEKKLQKVLELELEQLRLEKEKQLILEDKDKLEEDVITKSKELVNYTMLLAKKRELMIEMQNELTELKVKARNDVVRSRLQDLSHRIEVNLNDEQYLQLFETNFERVHQHFFQELKRMFPDISQKELRLCAFIKMNLTNKEMASILNISVRGVETARYRLKKNLGMEAEERMTELLERIGN